MPSSTARSLQVRLSLMMFLQYFVQGCYLPIVSVYMQDALGFSSWQLGLFGTALAVGPLFAPFVIGQVVDRHFATERVLAFCHLAGGAVMLLLFAQEKVWAVMVLGTLYSVLYIPTMMLTNSLAFHHLKRRDREFPLIRLWGTIGFVAPAWWIELYWLGGLEGTELNEARGIAFWLAGVAGVLMGLYCLTLPGTPPVPGTDQRRFAPGVVTGMLRLRPFATLVVVSFLIAIVHKFYFVWNSPFLTDILRSGGIQGAWEQRISSIGQIAEVAVMAGLGLMVSRLGFKVTMLVGLLAYLARCVIFSLAIGSGLTFAASMTLACLGQALHGFCFGCFLAAAFMFVDRISAKDIRGSMQTFYGTFVLGLGFFVGGFVAGSVGDAFTTSSASQTTMRDLIGISSTAGIVEMTKDGTLIGLRDWPGIWLSCAALAFLCVVVFTLFFPRQPADAESNES